MVDDTLRSTMRAMGYDVIRPHYYSPVPDVRALPQSLWETPSSLTGVTLDVEQCLSRLEGPLAPYLAEFSPPRSATGNAGEFYLDNGSYESVDAELLYAMVRHHRPQRIFEVGSGMSSLIIKAALLQNRADGHGAEYHVIDPYPVPTIASAIAEVAELTRTSITDVEVERFTTLGEADVLFVDSTHTVKTGSDVNFLILDVLPALAPGVVVHFHDIFLPYEYPREWLTKQHYYWSEQYLLQAFLAFNDAFEILVAADAVARSAPERLHQVIPSFNPSVEPGAFWLRRRVSIPHR